MSQPNILIFMTDHQRADTVLPEHPAGRDTHSVQRRRAVLYPALGHDPRLEIRFQRL